MVVTSFPSLSSSHTSEWEFGCQWRNMESLHPMGNPLTDKLPLAIKEENKEGGRARFWRNYG